jgi:predicted DNA-binding transcriptional regulator AlpA
MKARLLKVAEVAEMLGASTQTVRALEHDGSLPAVDVAPAAAEMRCLRWSTIDVNRFIRDRRARGVAR